MQYEQTLIPPATLAALVQAYTHCQQENTRLLAVLSGAEAWCEIAALELLVQLTQRAPQLLRGDSLYERTSGAITPRPILWIGDDLPTVANANSAPLQHIHRLEAQRLLGDECSFAVINCHDGLNANTLAAISGMLVGGGLFLLLTPELQDWPRLHDPGFIRTVSSGASGRRRQANHISPFLQRSVKFIRNNTTPESNLILVEQQACHVQDVQPFVSEKRSPRQFARPVENLPAAGDVPVATSGQQKVRDAAAKLITLEQGTVLVTAARGRGKSTALGFAIADALRSSDCTVVVVAPHRNNVRLLYHCLQLHGESLPAGALERVSYRAADALLQLHEQSGLLSQNVLLVVDEAAGLALSLLDRLDSVYPRKIIASTAQGYEGSGRGLLLRFARRLHRTHSSSNCVDVADDDNIPHTNTTQPLAKTDYYKHIFLSGPIRWAAGDPMENFIARLLCLADAPHAQKTVTPEPDSQLAFVKLESADLLRSEQLLQNVFGLLVEAHYQTQPNDLRLLLDAPYAHLWVAHDEQQPLQVVGVLLAVEEGAIDDSDLVAAIVAGKRRPRGNLLAQRMANFSGESSWCTARSLRVMRIAVAAQWQRRRVASELVSQMAQWATTQGCEYWSSSFGYRHELMGFWQSLGAMPIYLGMHLDKSSGARNLMLAKSLVSSTMETHIACAANQLAKNLGYWFPRFVPELNLADKQVLQRWAMSAAEAPQRVSTLPDIGLVARFIKHEIEVAVALAALSRLRTASPAFTGLGSQQSAREWSPQLNSFIDKAPDWTSLAQDLQQSGQAAVIKALRELCASLLPSAGSINNG